AVTAQRGPGLASRQRVETTETKPSGDLIQRSTRAGTRVPATAPVPAICSTPIRLALNEGRDSRPGNGLQLRGLARTAPLRSTRAGTRVPATGIHRLRPRRALCWARSTRAGTRVP